MELRDRSSRVVFAGAGAVGISHSGATRDTVEVLTLARKSGAATICITGAPKSPITRVSDVKLFTSAKETGFKTEAMSSRIVQFAIVDRLSVNIALKRGQEAAVGIQRVREATALKKL